MSAVLLAYAVALLLASAAVLAWSWRILKAARAVRATPEATAPRLARLAPAWRPQDHPTEPKGLTLPTDADWRTQGPEIDQDLYRLRGRHL